MRKLWRRVAPVVLAAGAGAVLGAAPAHGQAVAARAAIPAPVAIPVEAVVPDGAGPLGGAALARPAAAGTAVERGRYSVLVDLDANMLYFRQGDVTLWSAPVGTGTGIRLITDGNDWDFSTPAGQFEVQYKERDPLWIAPDWYFVENQLPIPPRYSPARYIRGTLGEAAVYIAPDLAIHGTDRPELLGQRVSHGCIRLENRYARRLYHNVQVGTEVIIVGGDDVRANPRVVDLRRGWDPVLATAAGRRDPRSPGGYDGWRRLPTADLLSVLERELAHGEAGRWDEAAVLLLERSRAGDDAALAGLFDRAGALPSPAVEREWATLLVDAYRASAARVLAALAGLEPGRAREATGLLVEASLALYHGSLDDSSAPWPTQRVARELLVGAAVEGWDILAAAELEHRVP